MPYGLKKELDTPGNNAKVESCVDEVMSQGHSKESAIRICKSAIQKAAEKRTHAGSKKD